MQKDKSIVWKNAFSIKRHSEVKKKPPKNKNPQSVLELNL